MLLPASIVHLFTRCLKTKLIIHHYLMKLYSLLVGLSLCGLMATSLSAQQIWEPLPSLPEGAEGIRDFAVDTSGVIYAATLSRGIFRSVDNAITWEAFSDGIANLSVPSIEVTPSNDVYIGNSRFAGLYRLDREQGRWQSIDIGFGDSVRLFGVLALDENIMLVGARRGDARGIFRTTNRGSVWKRVDTNYAGYDFDQIESGVILSRGINKLIRSVDSGKSWEPISAGLPSTYKVFDVAALPNSDVSFAAIKQESGTGDSTGIYRSLDDGISWDLVYQTYYPKGKVQFAEFVVIDPPSTVYAGTRSGIYRSTDLGDSWDSLLTVKQHYAVVQPATLLPLKDELLISTWYELLRVAKDGSVWKNVDQGFGRGRVRSIAALDDRTLIVTINHRVYRTDNGGLSWEEIFPAESAGTPIRLGSYGVQAYDNSRVFVQGTSVAEEPSFLLYSNDKGRTWSISTFDSASAGSRIAVDGSIIGKYYRHSAGGGYGFRRSEDGGVSWYELGLRLNPRQGFYAQYVALDSVILITGYDGRIYRTVNNGESWNEIDQLVNGDPGGNVNYRHTYQQMIMLSDGYVYARRKDTLYVSPDTGATWEAAKLSDIDPSQRLYLLGHGILFQGNTTDQLARSDDNGTNWTQYSAGTEQNESIVSLIASPSDKLFLATYNYEDGDQGQVYKALQSLRIEEDPTIIPEISLSPNPAAATFHLSFQLSKSNEIKVELFNLLGRKVTTLYQEKREAGTVNVECSVENVVPGIYLCRIYDGSQVISLPIHLIQ